MPGGKEPTVLYILTESIFGCVVIFLCVCVCVQLNLGYTEPLALHSVRMQKL